MFGKKFLSFLLFLTLLCVCLYTFIAIARGQRGKDLGNPATELEVQLILYKSEYLLREPIWVKITVTNVGKEKGWLYFTAVEDFRIKDSKNKEYPSNVSTSGSPGTIKPGETWEDETNLLFWYGLPEDKYRVYWYLPPEKYTIYFQLSNGIRSASYEFEVLEPKGDELRAMTLLKESYDLLIERKWDKSTNKMREIYQKYPNSRYAPFSLLRTASTLEDFYKLIQEYPNSREAPRVINAITDIFKREKDKAGCIDSLNSLMKRFPNTDISKGAEKQLKILKEEDFK